MFLESNQKSFVNQQTTSYLLLVSKFLKHIFLTQNQVGKYNYWGNFMGLLFLAVFTIILNKFILYNPYAYLT